VHLLLCNTQCATEFWRRTILENGHLEDQKGDGNILTLHWRYNLTCNYCPRRWGFYLCYSKSLTRCRPRRKEESSWNVMSHGDAREGKWRGNWRMEWVASTLHTTSEHGASSITTADAHTSAASSQLNWRLRRFKWTRPFRRKTKSGFCACAITFQTQSTAVHVQYLQLRTVHRRWHWKPNWEVRKEVVRSAGGLQHRN
jgi:hypothetical protein